MTFLIEFWSSRSWGHFRGLWGFWNVMTFLIDFFGVVGVGGILEDFGGFGMS